MQAGLALGTSQSQVLSAHLAQSVRLLHMSSMEFAQEIREALVRNPFLEEDDESASIAGDVPASLTDGQDARAKSQATPSAGEASDGSGDREDCFDDAHPFGEAHSFDDAHPFGEGLSCGDSPSPADSRPDDEPEGSEWTERLRTRQSLQSHLRDQLRLGQLSDRDRWLALVIIDALDDDGYLRQDLADIASALAQDLPGLEPADLEPALRFIQNLEPAGVGARSLAECLQLQLEALPETMPGRTRALRIVCDLLPLVATRDVARLRKLLGCDDTEVREAMALIRSLDPRPGARFSGDDTRYVVPDVYVQKVHNRWTVVLNSAVTPRLRINEIYASAFRRDGASVGQHLQEARWLIRNVQQRTTTIAQVAEAIVARQQRFLEWGDMAMRPMTLQEIADDLGLHESTISRVTTGKFMSTPRGLYEFKHFFSRQMETANGGVCSTRAIRALLKELISTEVPGKPLSDARLAQMLAERGIRVARRTVTKYRRSMNLCSAGVRALS